MRSLILAVCIYASLSGKYPPAHAQTTMSAEDATQDANISALNKHIENTDANVLRQEAALSTNALAIAEMQGEERVFFSILGVLTSVSIVIQVKGRKSQAA